MYWSESGELVVLACEDTFYVLRFSRENYVAAVQAGEVEDDGVEAHAIGPFALDEHVTVAIDLSLQIGQHALLDGRHGAAPRLELLLHRAEIDKLYGETQISGRALVVLNLHWKNGRLKAELGVAQGKVARDKRADLKKRATDRETAREVARFNRKHS